MPLLVGDKNVGRNIAELHGGKTFARTKAKFGKGKANKQAIAIALQKARGGKKMSHADKLKAQGPDR